jgi:hypothetical protein
MRGMKVFLMSAFMEEKPFSTGKHPGDCPGVR